MVVRAISVILAVILIGACSAPFAMAQPSDDPQLLQQIDQLVQSRLQRDGVPGIALTVIRNGRVLLHRGYGFADLSANVPVTNQTVFGLASCTKTFTALTLLTLVDQGAVDLDAQLCSYIPGLDRQYGRLTIRQLASMTAGVPKVVNPEVPWGPRQIQIMEQQKLHGAPGAQFEYSNFSYRLLGTVIENVTGQRYEKVVRERVLAPTRMLSTGTTVQLTPGGLLAQPYSGGDNGAPLRVAEYKAPAISFSAGMLATTNDDFAKYAFALLNRAFLSPAGYNTMWYQRPPLTTGAPSEWAFGYASTNPSIYGGQKVVIMNGSTPGVASTIILFPESGHAVLGLSNIQKPQAHAIASAVARLVFGQPVQNEEPQEYSTNYGAE